MTRLTPPNAARRRMLFRPSETVVRASLAAACLIAMLMVTLSMASAQDDSKAREACNPDYQKFCRGVMPGGGRIKKCLAEHRTALSDACRQVVDAAK